ncbi:MAG: hypothetical protein Q8N01_07530 [Sulfuricurvum sp.]|jgi:hypothetical protein|nr:hypothetical protein [Sulfuricurvum sp.]
MCDKDLLYIEDAHNQKLYYRFTPAAVVSNFIPLVVVLDNEKKAHSSDFEYKMWNILTPVYTHGDENKELLQKLIKQIAQEHECEDHIYVYGSSTGGYEAILQGILSKANAVFAHTPPIRLLDTNSTQSDLTNLLNPTDSFPIFYLCGNESNPEDDTAYFADACKKNGIKVHLDFCPKSDEDENHRLKEVLNFFERVASQN